MLRLETQHKKYLSNIGFLNSSIEDGLYRSIPKNYIKRRLIAYNLSKKHNLSGIPGFFKKKISNGVLADMKVFLYLYLIKMDIYKDYQYI